MQIMSNNLILMLYIEVRYALLRQSGTLMAKGCGQTPLSAFGYATLRSRTCSSKQMSAVTVVKQLALKMAGMWSPLKRLHHF